MSTAKNYPDPHGDKPLWPIAHTGLSHTGAYCTLGGVASTPHTELVRIADAEGPGATAARTALGDSPLRERLRAAISALADHRGPASSTCPSDAARAIGGAEWRDLMDDAREVARELAAEGDVEITQHGKTVDPQGQWRGPIRIRTRGRQ